MAGYVRPCGRLCETMWQDVRPCGRLCETMLAHLAVCYAQWEFSVTPIATTPSTCSMNIDDLEDM